MGIKDIEVTIDQKQLESSELPPFLSDEFKNMLLQKKLMQSMPRLFMILSKQI